MNIYTDDDTNPAAVRSEPVAVIGYGSQGRSHARNLKDSGCDVVVGVRDGGAGWKQAQEDGLEVASVKDAVKQAKLIAILTPDMTHEEIFNEQVAPGLSEGDTLLFAHGFTVLYGRVKPPAGVDVVLVAPKGPGDLVRTEYERG
ncbi:MAG: NAD(P)-binding domain-containing protein, partial [Pseudomonadota bacterium]